MLTNATQNRTVVVQITRRALIPKVLADVDAWKGLFSIMVQSVLVCSVNFWNKYIFSVLVDIVYLIFMYTAPCFHGIFQCPDTYFIQTRYGFTFITFKFPYSHVFEYISAICNFPNS